MSAAQNDTIVALSTAPGKAGIAVVRLSGPLAFEIALGRLGEGASQSTSLPHAQAKLHWLLDAQGRRLDHALIIAFHPPRSYTGEALVEFHLHGSPWVVDAVLSELGREARMADRGEFTRRAVENGRLTLDQAEATLELLDARSALSHRLAVRSLAGETGRRVGVLQDRLLALRSLVEAELDFAEHEIAPAPTVSLLTEAVDLVAIVAKWIESWRLGRLAGGAQVVLAGAPNAGKSTLMNVLAGEDRVLVDEAPGTTRDSISCVVQLEDLQVTLWDTAGLRNADDRVEQKGVARTRALLEEADLILHVIAPGDSDMVVIPRSEKCLRVLSKADLLPAQRKDPEASDGLSVSALSGQGVAELRSEIYRQLVGESWVLLEMVVCEARHRQLFERARAALERFILGLEQDLDRSLLAADLFDASQALDQISAPLDPDSLYQTIFSRFCVGK